MARGGNLPLSFVTVITARVFVCWLAALFCLICPAVPQVPFQWIHPRGLGQDHPLQATANKLPAGCGFLAHTSAQRVHPAMLPASHGPGASSDVEADNPSLPFASSYAPAHQGALPQQATTPPQQSSGVCILRDTGAPDAAPLRLDCKQLQQAGFKDVIVTSPGLPAPLACMVADTPDRLGSSTFLGRCSSMAGTFRTCWVLLPCTLGVHPAVLQLMCDIRFKGKLLLHYYVPGDDLTEVLLQLVACCSINSPAAQQLAADAEQELLAAITCSSALDACLAVLASGG